MPITQDKGQLESLRAQLAEERDALVTGIQEAYAEIDQTLRSAFTALDHGDEAEAKRLLNAALDIECDFSGDCEVLGDLSEAWGIDFEADR